MKKKTSSAHRSFRLNMGFNDGSDRLRSTIGLSERYYRSWPKHLVAKTLEDGIINAYGNYLLDPNCDVEPFVVFMIQLIDELLTSGKDLRTRDMGVSFRRSYGGGSKRPVPGSDAALRMGENCNGGQCIASIVHLPKKQRTKKCQFCSRQHAQYKCRSCKAHLCMIRPKDTDAGLSFRANGPCCYLRYHGISTFPRGN